MLKLLAEVGGKLHDLTDMPPEQAAAYLQQARSVAIAHPDPAETVNHYPGPDRWLHGGKPVDPATLPDGWGLPRGRLQRPGGRENPHKPATKTKPEVRAKWRLSTPRI